MLWTQSSPTEHALNTHLNERRRSRFCPRDEVIIKRCIFIWRHILTLQKIARPAINEKKNLEFHHVLNMLLVNIMISKRLYTLPTTQISCSCRSCFIQFLSLSPSLYLRGTTQLCASSNSNSMCTMPIWTQCVSFHHRIEERISSYVNRVHFNYFPCR